MRSRRLQLLPSKRSPTERNLGELTLEALTSPLGMALQIAMLVALALLLGGLRPERLVRDDEGGPPEGNSAFPR